MAKGFIDMTALTSALGAVRQGKNVSLSSWHDRNLLEVTYLLLHDKMRVIPHPGDRGGELGDTAIFFSVLPEITTTVSEAKQKVASEETKVWVDNHQDILADAWEKAKNNQSLWEWAGPQRELRWLEQSQTYGGLFDETSIPYIAKLIPESEERIRKIYSMSTDHRHVRRWLKIVGEEAEIAYRAWVLGCFIRGKYYENLAKHTRMQLVSHPLRTGLEETLKKGPSQNVRLSEELFAKILIGSAQIETSAERRVAVLGKNIENARRAIEAKAIVLPDTMTADKAEEFAIQAARGAGINIVARLYRQLIERFADVGAHTFLAYSLSYWVPHETIPAINAAAHFGYHQLRHLSPGEEITKLAFATKERFRWLSTLPAGRLDHEIAIHKETPVKKP
jgi:hypothetical protein